MGGQPQGARQEAILDNLVSTLRLVPLTAEIARAAGLLKRAYGKSHGISVADAIVAATTQSENAELLTCNVRHFPMIKGLEPAYPR